MINDQEIYNTYSEIINKIRDVIRNTEDIISSGAINSFQRMLVHVACNLEPEVDCIKYSQWLYTGYCRYHKTKMVWYDNDINNPCTDIMCCGRCPNEDHLDLCDLTEAKIKQRYLAIFNSKVYSKKDLDTEQIREMNLIVPWELEQLWNN
jgi:hypothetical protein